MNSFYLFLGLTFGQIFYAISQPPSDLRAFTNYGSCYQGLQTTEGKVIWPAEFESIIKYSNFESPFYPYSHFWIAEKNGSFGVIDNDGKLLLPFKYTKISYRREGFIASVDTVVYLFSSNQDTLVHLSGYSWLTLTTTGLIVERNGKMGFLDEQKKTILEPKFDHVSFYKNRGWSYDESYDESNRYLNVELQGENGIFDLEQHKWIVPLTTNYIYPQFVMNCPNSDAIFHISDIKTYEAGIINSSGATALPLTKPNHPIIEITPLDSCGKKSHQFAYLTENNRMKVVDLRSGATSSEYNEIYPLSGYSIFFNEKKWGVLDTNFVESKQFPYPKYPTESIDIYDYGSASYVAIERFNVLFAEYHQPKIDSVLITKKIIPEKKQVGYQSEVHGLVNFWTGKRIKESYSNIRRITFEGATYYWATRYTGDGSEREFTELLQFDIYNSDLKRIQQFKQLNWIESLYSHDIGQRTIINCAGKIGVINPRGEAVIPIEFDRCDIKKVGSKGNPTTQKLIFITGDENNTNSRIYDYNGNLLLSKNDQYFTVIGDLIISTKENRLLDFYNSECELLMADAESYRHAPFVDEYGNCYDEVDQFHRERPRTAYLIKENYIYAFVNDAFLRLDENYFKFTENYCFLHHWWLIDQTGKIVTLTPKGISTRPKHYNSTYERLTECSTFIEEYPVPEKIVPKPKPIVQTPPRPEVKKAFEWKQRKSSKPNEWYLYNGNGIPLYQESFEYPMPVDHFTGGVFKQNGKYGYFDSQYNQFLAAEYDYIYPNLPITLRNGKWQFHDRTNQNVSEAFEQVSILNRSLRFVFEDGKIGLLNDSLELEIPLTDSAEFIQKYDLVKLLNLQKNHSYKNYQAIGNVVHNAEPKEVYRIINNRALVEEAYFNSTANHSLQFYPVDLNRGDLPYQLINSTYFFAADAHKVELIPSYYNQYYFSEMRYSWTQNVNAVYSSFGTMDASNKDRELLNYKIVGNDLIAITLNDVLKSDAASTKKINEMLTKKLTDIQAFGANCTDIESKLQLLKSNFLLAGNRIIFYWPERGGFSIELSYIELKGLILEPTKLTPLTF